MLQYANKAGKALLAFVVLVVVLAFFVNLLTGIFFILGAMGTKLCPLVAQDKLFTEILDQPQYFNNEYLLGKAVLNNASHPLTFYKAR